MACAGSTSQAQLERFQFKLKPGCDNYADCDGDYILDASKGTINTKPVYVNSKKGKFLAALEGTGWCITAMNYFKEVKTQQGTFGGFHSGGAEEPEEGSWRSYDVSRQGQCRSSNRLDEASSWHKLANTTVTFKAVANSGVVRSESDFRAIRRRCVALDCGGFAWRKPHYNQFGEEDDPPICFFFRRAQKDIRSALQRSDKFDLYIACDAYRPDCSFKPGRDPAPSCHINWDAGGRVHAFACQLQVQEASPATYYCACGFHCGYSGIQQLDNKKQLVLFSVWNHPSANSRVKSSALCDGVVLTPFGGEGMGMKAAITSGGSCQGENCSVAAWRPGVAYIFVVKAFPVSEGTEFVCLLHKPGEGWREIARHMRPEPPSPERGSLSGLYSFIEDFAGNSLRRSGCYSAWVKHTSTSPWTPVSRIKGTSTAEDDVPNKCVALEADCYGGQHVKMVSGGDCLQDCKLYKGDLRPVGVPPALQQI